MIFNIQQFIDHDYATDTRKDRRKGNGGTQEFFTPFSIVHKMCNMISDETWADPEKTWLEPCMGDGNFICYIIWNRIQHGIDWQTALKTLRGDERHYFTSLHKAGLYVGKQRAQAEYALMKCKDVNGWYVYKVDGSKVMWENIDEKLN